jgi:RNA polymerase sigma-70 factor (ECF subfamily)
MLDDLCAGAGARLTPERGSPPVGEWAGHVGQTPPDFARVYDDYHARVRACAAKLVGRDDADDVAQEVFLKVSRALETLADPARLSSWIYAITLNTVRDTARARAVRPAPAPADAEARFARAADPAARTPEQAASRNEMVACYVDYVKQLPRDYYEVYALAEFECRSNAAIARRLALPLATVKIRLHRARARLHDELRRNCRCYYDEQGELMAEPKRASSARRRSPGRRRRGRTGRPTGRGA